MPNAVLRLDGGLSCKGSPNNLVNIISSDIENPGAGIVINDVANDKTIDIQYTRFLHIKKPLSFEFRWGRRNVNFMHNVVKYSHFEGAAIQVKEIDNLLVNERILFNFKRNTFSNNTASILLSDITSDLLTIDLEDNVITQNSYTGKKRNGVFTSPLFFTYNKYQRNETPILQGNSIFSNYYSLHLPDTVYLGKTNISVVGSAEKLDLSKNYFGAPDDKEIQESFDFVSANYSAPYLYFDDLLKSPPSTINGHFYEVTVDGNPLQETYSLKSKLYNLKSIEFLFNRSVAPGKDYRMLYHFLDGDSIATVEIKHSQKWSDNNTRLNLNVLDRFNGVSNVGFIEISGLYDGDGMDVPTLYIGKESIRSPKIRTYIPRLVKNKENETIAGENVPDVVNPTEEIEFETLVNDSLVNRKKKYWDWGVFIGNSVYFGDVNRTTVSVNPRNMRPNGGLRLGYQPFEKLRLELRNNYMVIAGSDRGPNPEQNQRGTNFERNLSFRTTIIDASFMIEYNIIPFKKITTFVPFVFSGANAFYFKPMGQVEGDDQWYDLRSIGTEGQTINGAQNQYDKVMMGIPYGIGIKRHLTQNTIISVSYTYNKIFTDYLDDISVGRYPDPEALKAANPDLGNVAVALSNPSNLTGQRSASAKYDGYGFWGIGFNFKFK
jgi:hypothetical protein